VTWSVFEGGEAGHLEQHVLPDADLRPHRHSPECWCCPDEDDEAALFFVHHALDGRELFESGLRAPS